MVVISFIAMRERGTFIKEPCEAPFFKGHKVERQSKTQTLIKPKK